MATVEAAPPPPSEPEVIRPHTGPQERFCRSRADEVLYGGAAGGGKGYALLLEALRFAHVPRYRAVIFRREYPALERSQIAESWKLCMALGGDYSEQKKRWVFPSGAVLQFSHLEHRSDVYDHASAEYAYIGFDELTEFEEGQYRFLHSRLRTTALLSDGAPLPCRVRAATNPGNIGHDWVKARWRAWLGDRPTAMSGEIRWYVQREDVDTEVPRGTPGALSRQFILAKLEDNPTLLARNPGYRATLDALPLVLRMALRDGRWDLVIQGNVLRREWFENRADGKPTRIKWAPEGLNWVRYYDLAVSLKETASRTATVQVALGNGNLYLRRGWAGRIEWPEQVEKIRAYMLNERDVTHGIEAKLHGSAMLQALRRDPELVGIRFEGIGVEKGKLERALIWSPRAEEGRVIFVEEDDPAWPGPWIDEFAVFDGQSRTFDDRVDCVSGGVQMIGSMAPPAYSGFPTEPRPAERVFDRPSGRVFGRDNARILGRR